MRSGNGKQAQSGLKKFQRNYNKKNSSGRISPDNADLDLGDPLHTVQTRRVLEPRILLDAAGMETGQTIMESVAIEQAETYFSDRGTSLHHQNPNFDLFSNWQNSNWHDQDDSVPEAESTEGDEITTDGVANAVSSSIIFIDPSVEDIDKLIATFDPNSEIVILSAQSDGVEQIADYLEGRSDISSIHIISHGRPGTLELGNAQLTALTMSGQHADELAVIRSALSQDADILIYGCDFAAGPRGANAVIALAEATGADIAASDDLTGAASLGGDWDLEIQTGEISAIAISPLDWASTLDLAISNVGVGGVNITGAAVDALAQQILGDGVTINSASYSGGASQAATFNTGAGASFGNDILTFTDGAIFSTGTAASVAGPNNSSSFTVNAPGIDGDPDFNSLAGNSTFDASFIEITFTPDVPPGASPGDVARMTMEIVFGSDEYNEYVYGGVNDTLAVIVNGVNQAVVPNGLAIGIDTINDAGTFNPTFGSPTLDPNPEHTAATFESANASLYTNNETNAFNTQMDGFTITIPVTFDVIVGQPNTIKIGIADTGDASFDSWMFVKADSGQTVIVAESDSVSTPTNIPFNIDVTANDYDLQGDTLTVTHILGQPINPGDTITLASGVDVTLELDGTLTVEGDGTNTANDAFTYSISDGNGGTSTAFVNVNITAPIVNTPPVGVDDIISVTEDMTAGPVSVLGNDTDVDGDPLTISAAAIDTNGDGTPDALVLGAPTAMVTSTGAAIGVITVASNGEVTFSPAQNYNGPMPDLTYTPNDGSVDGTPATVTFGSIIPVNDPPVGVDDNIPVTEDTSVTQNVLGNDTDADGDLLTISSAAIDWNGDGNPDPLVLGAPTAMVTSTAAAIGVITVNANGDVTFVPASNYTGPVPDLTYTPNDGSVDGTPATVTFGPISPVNDAPVLDLDNDDSSDSTGAGTGANYEATYIENAPGIAIVDSDFVLTDIDNQIAELVITLTDGQIGDTLQFPSSLPGGISASVVPGATLVAPGTMTITLTGMGVTTEADWQAALASITFLPSTNDVHNPDPSDRHITVQASDANSLNSNLATATIHVVPENDPPTLDLDDDNSSGINSGNYQGTYTENDPGVPISSGVIISDLDDPDLQGMTITLTNGEIGDILNIGALPPGISLVGAVPADLAAPGTITLQLTGTASLADYQNAIAAITFANTSENPVGGVRAITVEGTDGTDPTPVRTAFITMVPVNDPPVPIDPLDPGNPPADPNAVIPAQSGDDSSALTPLDASQYFADPDDTVLTYSLDPAAPSWLSINPVTGEVTGTPPSDASQNSNTGTPGEYEAIIIATDPGGLTGQTTAIYTITNPAPDALDDDFATNENDAALSGNVLTANNGNGIDFDADGDTPLSVIDVNGNGLAGVGVPLAGTGGGLFTIDANGGFTFDDNGDFEDLAVGETRDTTITYAISDGQGGTDTATVTVTVTGTNDAPVLVPGSSIADASGNDAETITPIDVTSAFTDPDANDDLTYTATNLPAGLSLDPVSGLITGTIDPSASQGGDDPVGAPGLYTIVVTADDGNGGTVTDSFTYSIANPPPDALDDDLVGDEDTIASGSNVLADNGNGADADPDGDAPLQITEVDGDGANVGTPTAGTNGGLFTINSDGSLTFDPNGDFEYLAVGESATTTISYQLSDGEGGFDTASVTYTVNGVNDAPVPVDPFDPLTPPADPNDYFPLQTGADNQPVTPLDVTQYFGDPDTTDSLTYTIDPLQLPPGLTFDGTQISGTLDPNASQGGDDPVGNPGVYLIPVLVEDGNGGSFTTTITYNISNPPPVAADDAVTGDEDNIASGDLFADNGSGADTDPDGDTIEVTLINGAAFTPGSQITLPSGALLTVNTDGSFDYDPNGQFDSLAPGANGTDSFTYTIDDGEGGTDTATVNLTITGVNDAPVVTTPIADQSALDNEIVSIVPDIDDIDGGPLTYSATGLPTGLTIDPATGEISGTIDNSASQGGPLGDGNYSITITADDGLGGTVEDVFVLSVSNPAPVIDVPLADQTFDDNQTVSLIPSISDPDNDTLVYSATGLPTGLMIDPATGEISGTIDNSASQGGPLNDGVYTVTVTADDGEGGTVDDVIVFTISNPAPVVDIPVADQTFDDNQTVSLTPSISDPDNDTLVYTVSGLPAGLMINPVTGEISGTIDNSASQGGPLNDGVYTVTVTADDGEGGTVDDVITFTISNPAPVAQDDDVETDEDSALSGDVHADNNNGIDSDSDADDFDVTLVGGSSANLGSATAGSNGGSFIINSDGSFSFDPGTDFQDLDETESRVTTITYTIDDGEGGTSQATLSVTVTGANDAPVVIDPNDPFPNPNDPPVPGDPNNVIPDQTASDNTPITPLVIAPYFVDVDGESLTFGFDPLDPNIPAWLSIDPVSGEITGTPPSNASQGGPLGNGVYPITVTASDPDGETVSTTVDFTVSNLPPVAVNDTASGNEDENQTGNVITDPLTGDSDGGLDNDALTVTDVNGTAVSSGSPAVLALTYGDLTFNEDGSWSFAPNSLANQLSDTDPAAVETVTYTIDDGNGGTAQATLEITINGINDPVQVVDPNDPSTDPQDPSYDPVNPTVIADPDNLIPDVSATDGETPAIIPAGDYFGDAEGDTLTFSASNLPDGLTIDPLTGLISGIVGPDASQNGNTAPGVYDVVITATDPQNNTATTTITYTVSNIPPQAQDDIVTHGEDGIGSGDLFADNGNGLDQDTAPDSDPVTVSAVAGNVANIGIATPGANGGSFTINSDGTYVFDPGTDFQDLDNGETRDTTITYQISDGNGGYDTATVTVTVEGANDAPVVIDPNDPFPNPNDPPVPADPDNVIPDQSGSDGVALTPLDVSPYFVDVDVETLTFGFDPLDPDVPAWMMIDPVSGIISGTPPSDASQGGPNNDGVYSITVTAMDPDGEIVTTTVDFSIANILPDAQDDDVTHSEDGISSGNVFADNGNGIDQDTPPDMDPISVSEVGGVSTNVGAPVPGTTGGLFTINSDGSYEFDPGTDFQDLNDGETRVTTISYTIDDGNGGTDTATITVTVEGANDGPVIIDPEDPFPNPNNPPVPNDPQNVIPDVQGSDSTPLVPLDVSPYFYDVEGDTLLFVLEPGTAPAWMSIDPVTGIISGTPPSDASIGGPNDNGVYTVVVIAIDNSGAEVSTTIEFTISNPAPTATWLPDDTEVAGNSYELETAQAFADPDGDVLTFSATGLPQGLTIDPVTGVIGGQVDPAAVGNAPNGDGIYLVEITANDGQGGTITLTFTLTISDPAAPPLENPQLPIVPDQPDGPPSDGGQPDLIVVKAVNAINPLGPHSGIFKTDHPLTEALFEISPLSEGISLDANGHPVTQMVSWIEKTRLHLSDVENDLSDYWAGGDKRSFDGTSELIVRTLVWNDIVFVEILSGQLGTAWEVESFNGGSKPKDLESYGANLLAISSGYGSAANELILVGSDENGNETRIEIQLDLPSGNIRQVQVISDQQAKSLASQIQALITKPNQEINSLFNSLI